LLKLLVRQSQPCIISTESPWEAVAVARLDLILQVLQGREIILLIDETEIKNRARQQVMSKDNTSEWPRRKWHSGSYRLWVN